MKGLPEREMDLLRGIFCQHGKIEEVVLFGSRAKGTQTEASDVDLALKGDLNSTEAEEIAGELDELPLPYLFNVVALKEVKHVDLLDQISRVGVRLYQA